MRLPVISRYDLSCAMQKMYGDSAKALRVRRTTPVKSDFDRFRRMLLQASIIVPDRDYRRHFRVTAVPEPPADEIVCLSDRLCHVSHLSAMQRWGLTDRVPKMLMITRSDDRGAVLRLKKIMAADSAEPLVPLRNVVHPSTVRRLPVRICKTARPGASVRAQDSFIRLTTIGQTFLDMLCRPDLCGGMRHVIEVWQEHAEYHLNAVVQAVDEADSQIAKCRAGYIITEVLGLKDKRVEAWKIVRQRGGSRKLDPSREFATEHSEAWMMSINV